MKKILISGAIVALIVSVFGCMNARATYKGFQGSASYSEQKVSMESNAKENFEYLAGVKWETSDKKNHRMWFTIKNSNQASRGTILIEKPSKEVHFLDTSAKKGYYYWLWAHREHWGNPSTYVSGTWQP